MPFEVFDRRSAARTEEPWMTIQRRGNFSMNESAARLIAGDKDPNQLKIELLFDPERQAVGFRRAQGNPNPYVLRRQTNSQVYIVAGKAFTEHYQIDTTTARRYSARQLEEGIVGFELGDRHSEVGREVGDGESSEEI